MYKSKFDEYTEALEKIEADIKKSETLRAQIVQRIVSEANRFFYNAPVKKRFTIPDSCRVWGLVHDRPNWVVPQDKDIPQKYWGCIVQNRLVEYYEV